MATAIAAPPLTYEELLTMPNDGIDRWLINGELREKPMTRRNRFHSRIMSTISRFLGNWNENLPRPGQVLSGEAGVVLERDPQTGVGIDVVYVSAELAAQQDDESTLIVGVPTLAVEILSPSDTQKEIDEKTDAYLEAGVPLVWIVDPHDRTILVHRPDALPRLFNCDDELTAEPNLPGFRVAVSRIFE